MDPEWRRVLLVCIQNADGSVRVERKQQVPMRADLVELFSTDELKKYFTPGELGPGSD
jgi:succinate dehydrogenase / fumarate reductase flavoprotein subunit